MSFEPSLFQVHAGIWMTLSGLLIGAGLGMIAERSGFCAMGGITDYLLIGDSRRFRAWALAAGVAVLGAAMLTLAAGLPLAITAPRQRGLSLLASATGGLLFGVGMVFAGGCAFRNVVRAGQGDVASLLVAIVIAVSASATLHGPLHPLLLVFNGDRVTGDNGGAGLIDWLPSTAGVALGWAEPWLGLAIGGVVVTLALASATFRSSPRHWLAGAAIGALVTLGFLVTWLAYDELALTSQRPASATFVGPLVETGRWLAGPWSAAPRFGVAVVIGTLIGAAMAALVRGELRATWSSGPADFSRRLGGAVLMGFGGVLAGGCTIGQGVTGIATLASDALVTIVFLVAGGGLGVKALVAWQEREE